MQKKFFIEVTESDHRNCTYKFGLLALDPDWGLYKMCKLSEKEKALSFFSKKKAIKSMEEAEQQIKNLGSLSDEAVDYRFKLFEDWI